MLKEFANRVARGARSHEVIPTPSPFVLTQDDVDTRLNIGEKTILEPGKQRDSVKNMISLTIAPEAESITISQQWDSGEYLRAIWGKYRKLGKKYENPDDGEWGHTFTPNAFTEHDGERYILGSMVHINDTATIMQGPGWTLEYLPIRSCGLEGN